MVDLGFHVETRQRFRLAGINAPEPRGDTRADGIASKEALCLMLFDTAERVHKGRQCVIYSFKGKSFDRWVARVLVKPDASDEMPIDVGEWMTRNGPAEPS